MDRCYDCFNRGGCETLEVFRKICDIMTIYVMNCNKNPKKPPPYKTHHPRAVEILENSEDLDPGIAKIINENFGKLIE